MFLADRFVIATHRTSMIEVRLPETTEKCIQLTILLIAVALYFKACSKTNKFESSPLDSSVPIELRSQR